MISGVYMKYSVEEKKSVVC